jgi:hypothetical protein
MLCQRFVLLVIVTVLLTPAAATMAWAQQPSEVRRVVLPRDTVVGGTHCQATKRPAGFYASGTLETCALAEETELFDHRFMPGTWLRFTAAGELRSAWLIRDTELQGYACKGTGFGGWAVDFYPSGRLRLCYLAHEQVIQNVPCRKGSLWGEITGGVQVTFHETGALESCSAARRFSLDGVTFEVRQRVRLDPSGRPLVDMDVE